MSGLLDTNVALYLLGGRLAKPMPAGNYAISVITEMELLAWPSPDSRTSNDAWRTSDVLRLRLLRELPQITLAVETKWAARSILYPRRSFIRARAPAPRSLPAR
jgi:predicted nucleic acid-binding protein